MCIGIMRFAFCVFNGTHIIVDFTVERSSDRWKVRRVVADAAHNSSHSQNYIFPKRLISTKISDRAERPNPMKHSPSALLPLVALASPFRPLSLTASIFPYLTSCPPGSLWLRAFPALTYSGRWLPRTFLPVNRLAGSWP